MTGTPLTPQNQHQRTPSSGIMSASTTTMSGTPNGLASKSRFPRLQECAHFHYEVSTVDIPKNFRVVMCRETDDINKSNSASSSFNGYGINNLTASTISGLSNGGSNNVGSDSTVWFQLQVTSNDKKWNIYRTNENFKYLDKFLHDCIFDRKFSSLEEPVSFQSLVNNDSTSSSATTFKNNKTPNSKSHVDSNAYRQVRNGLSSYLERFCEIAFINAINCGPILNWFEIDNKGNRLFAIDDSPINIPGVAAAIVKKRYVAQSLDEISLEVNNMISVIDMPPTDESSWWRGKKELEVGFFPYECVELIKMTHPLPSQVTDHLPQSSNHSVRMKHGKLVTILRSFFTQRPARMHLQSKGIIKQRVFNCDLGEHLSNTQQNVPKILKICTEFIEKNGMVDGIYRHTGLQSNIQRLRNAFDEERWHEIDQECYLNDVHSVSSLLKMYFRELPNPLLTFQLYQKFIIIAEDLMKAVNIEDKIVEIYDVVQQLPPPHYRTLVFLMQHLFKMSGYASETNMNTKNLAIVWAPNLLKCKEMEGNSTLQLDMLHSITLQANISEFLIANADTIFNDKFASLVRKPDHKSNIAKAYRPISVCNSNTNPSGGAAGSKLLSLEEAQDKYRQVGPTEMPKYHTVIEIPDKQKKKQKDKNKGNQSSSSSSNSTANQQAAILTLHQPPTNIQIQQQFEQLQQQQQQQPSQLTTSASFHCMSTAAATTPTKPTNGTNAQQTSSPAFKSIFKNFRGSLKHQSNNSTSANNVNEAPSTLQTFSTPPSSHTNHANNSASISRTNSIFKANSNQMTASAYSVNSPSMERKHDYSNCISQLQSAAAQAISSKSNQSPASMMSSNCDNISPAPVMLRNNKFNQSMNSNHSINTLNMTNSNQQETLNSFLGKLNDGASNKQQQNVLSTFNKDLSSPSTTSTSGDVRSTGNNQVPMPSKRRTIQGPPTNSTSSISSFQKPLAPVMTGVCPQPASTDHCQASPALPPPPPIDELKESHAADEMQGREDDMQQLVAYINQFEKENISSAAAVSNVVQNDAYIEMTPNQLEKLKSNQQEAEIIHLASPTPDRELENDHIASKLRLSSSSLSSSNESLENHNSIKFRNKSPENQLDTNEKLPSPDRRTYVINRIYGSGEDNQDEVEDIEGNEQVVLKVPATTGESRNDNQYENVAINSPTEKNEPIYVNMPNNSDQGQREQSGQEDEYRRLSSEKNQDENFDSELIELNNQIKQLLVDNDQNRTVTVTNEEPVNVKPTPAVRPKSANYLNARKTAAPPPPVQENTAAVEIAKRRTALKTTEHANESSVSATSYICKSSSTDQIKKPLKQQVRHSFKKNPEDSSEVTVFGGNNRDNNQAIPNGSMSTKPNPETSIQINRSMSKSLQDCQSHIPNSPRKQRKTVGNNNVNHNNNNNNNSESIEIDAFVSNLEKLDVKTKIKLMESFVATNPIPIGKTSERSASTSSTGSTASSTSSSSSKSPTISPKDEWAPPPVMTRSSIKAKPQDPSVLVKNNENSFENLEEILTKTQATNNSVSQKQTLVECNVNNNTDNIINVSDLSSEVKEIFDKMSFDKMANDILLSKPNQQSFASLKEKEKRRTVKELMSKFEKK